MVDYDAVVVGAGVAGMTAAIYLKRANKNVLLLERSAPGGQITRTAAIENYPGFKSIEGPELAMNMFEQTQNLGIEYKYGDVLDIIDGDIKTIKTDVGQITTKAIIIATGRKPRELGLENEKSLTGRGVSWCAICDAPLYKGKEVAVIGGGTSAVEEGIYLSNIVKKVYLVHRRQGFRTDEVLVNKLRNKANVEFILDAKVEAINEKDGKLESITINGKDLFVEGMFIYIGNTPNTDGFKSLNLELKNDYILADKNMRTSKKGIYACGDIIHQSFYQVSIAVGQAAIAALSLLNDLE
jgi:thioredoxin reductase (NADPH)